MIHTLSVLVENKPGALVRVCQCSPGAGFNIESLAVGPTERHDVSRITLRVNCEQQPLEQIEKQMHKLVNVLRVRELGRASAVERELALITIAAPPERRAELMALADVFQARVADVGPETLVLRGRRRAGGARLVRGARPPARHPGARPHRPDRPRARVRSAALTVQAIRPTERNAPWQRFTAKATSASSTGRSRSSATAARATPMR